VASAKAEALEGAERQRAAHQAREERGRAGDQCAAPGAEHDHGRDVHARGDAEDAGAEGLADACVLGLLQQLGGQRRGSEQRQRGQRLAGSRDPAGNAGADAARDGQVREQREPHISPYRNDGVGT